MILSTIISTNDFLFLFPLGLPSKNIAVRIAGQICIILGITLKIDKFVNMYRFYEAILSYKFYFNNVRATSR